MYPSDTQIEKWLMEEDSASEIEDNLEEEYDSDDSVADPTFVPTDIYENDCENIITHVPDPELPALLEPSTSREPMERSTRSATTEPSTSRASMAPSTSQTSMESSASSVSVQSTNSRLISSALETPTGSLIVRPPTSSVRGKNNYIWSIESSSRARSNRTASRNIVHIVPGPKPEGKDVIEPVECFQKFITPAMLDEILLRTNEDISSKSSKYKYQNSTISQTRIEELKALLGLIIFSGAMGNNNIPTKELFDPTQCGSQYIATMSLERFEFLLRCLHFDDRNTREVRRQRDKFAPIRNIWEMFIQRCRDLYKPGSYVTIDEQLLGFRGRCPFRMYIPNKPAKYGLKIILACDVNSKYMFDACPYLGKNDQVPTEPLGTHYCKLLTKTIYGSNRNITTDNWFTSVPLAEQLLAEPYKLTLLGTIKANKKEIPSEFKHDASRRVGTSMFGFHDKLTLVSFKAKPQKTVLLLSTMHDEPAIDPVSKKPVIITSYNATKGAVDTFDQMCGHLSCNRKTRRWPLCLFYGILNMAVLNSYILYVDNSRTKGIKPMNRRTYMKAISYDLIRPWCVIRGEERKKMRKRVREAIEDVLNTENAQNLEGNVIKKGKRSMCHSCPAKKRRMSVYYCAKCNKPYCLEHRSPNCFSCDKK